MTVPSYDLREIREVLADFPDPETGRTIQQTQQLQSVAWDDSTLVVRVGLTSHSAMLRDDVRNELIDRLRTRFPDLGPIDVQFTDQVRRPEPRGEIGVRAKTVIAVGSGKGGVGKSTIAAALAVGLARAGSHVGLMDADVYGPSIPHLFGASGRPEIGEDRKIRPHVAAGLRIMSMGLLVGPAEAVVWRGPMLHGAITQFLRDTDWGDLDYLIIDMPPGTGDIALSLSQVLPLTGAVVVCTPQDVALLDANKAIAMFQKVNIKILGIVENMSGFDCPNCGTTHEIFGKGGARARAEDLSVPFLGSVPIQLSVRVLGDEGHLEHLFDDHVTSKPMQQLCYQLIKSLSQTAAAHPVMPPLPVL